MSRRTVLRDLIPFFMILITYESLRGFGDGVRFIDIHVVDIIVFEKSLFGGIIPAYYLQSTLMQGSFGMFFNYLTVAFYASHYFVPLIVAILLWYRSRSHYWPFVIGFILVAYIGFIVYIFFPAAPPWWATKYGYLVDQPVNLPASFVAMSSLTLHIGPNKVAAMPSLHMSFPTYSALFCIYAWGGKYFWLLAFPLCVGFSTIYLGHHYIIDLLAGMVLALSVFSGVRVVHVNLAQVQDRIEQRDRRRLAKNSLHQS
jgi:membrane-associated phospholipid phosphatase